MTYDQADNILQNQPPDEPGAKPPPPLTAGGAVATMLIPTLRNSLTLLTRLSRKLRAKREEIGGAVDLSSGDLGTELKFTLDENGNPTKVIPKADKEIHHTIAEMMILANSYVAEKICKGFPDSALLRVHLAAEEERFDDLRDMLEASGIPFDGSSNMALAQSLKMAQQKGLASGNGTVNALFRSLATRAMSEAQYVCTGDHDQNHGIAFFHYGLGLDYYTHFTSPIRRYADVVVHKQLLATLLREQQPPPPTATPSSILAIGKPALPSLPDSTVVSILAGEGLEGRDAVDNDDFLDELIAGAAEMVLGTVKEVPQRPNEMSTEAMASDRDPIYKPYISNEVSKICEGLNLHNRLAKHSSVECQKLFLSLYFRSHSEVTEAVVVNLRSNGFWAYLPRFDMRIPVFVKDSADQLQIDPAFLGLPPNAGLEPDAGFTSSGSFCRRFPTGKCELIGGETDGHLQISLPGTSKTFAVKVLDVVTVHLSCDNWDLRARVPFPRAHLVFKTNSMKNRPNNSAKVEVTSKALSARASSHKTASILEINGGDNSTIFEILCSIQLQPVLDVELRTTPERILKDMPRDRQVTFPGRFRYGEFVNPDTRMAMQEAARKSAEAEATQRRRNAAAYAARRSEYNTTQQYERDALARQQRLLAEKRNARRSKAK